MRFHQLIIRILSGCTILLFTVLGFQNCGAPLPERIANTENLGNEIDEPSQGSPNFGEGAKRKKCGKKCKFIIL